MKIIYDIKPCRVASILYEYIITDDEIQNKVINYYTGFYKPSIKDVRDYLIRTLNALGGYALLYNKDDLYFDFFNWFERKEIVDRDNHKVLNITKYNDFASLYTPFIDDIKEVRKYFYQNPTNVTVFKIRPFWTESGRINMRFRYPLGAMFEDHDDDDLDENNPVDNGPYDRVYDFIDLRDVNKTNTTRIYKRVF